MEETQAGHNTSMKIKKLHKQAKRAHTWRTKVWAEQELRIRRVNSELRELGAEEYVPYPVDFNNVETLEYQSKISVDA